jgi:antitoxin component YwqK of YwqJK toxin-antitoxin module
MKATILLIILFLIPTYFYSQGKNDKIMYLDSLWNETTIEDFKYVRVIKDYSLKRKDYIVIDYYDSGKVKMEGKTEDKDELSRTGQFHYYYKNGNRESISFFKKNKPVGKYYELYENGYKKVEGEFLEEDKKKPNIYKIQNYWDENNSQKVIEGNGVYEEKENNFYSKGKIKKGAKDSIWMGWFNNPKILFQEEYKEGKFISGISRGEDNSSNPYLEVEKKPVPAQGMSHFYHYISDKLHTRSSKRIIGFKTVEVTAEELEKIKKNYRRNSQISDHSEFEGKTYVNFVVEKDGEITNAKIIKSIDPTLDVVIINLLINYGNWIPGEQRGIKVRCTYSLPISIQSSN